MNSITNFYSELLIKKNKTLLLLTLFLFNFFNVFAQTSTLISNCSDFNNGSAAAWPYVLVATAIDSGAVSQGAQTYTMNITSLPVGGANVRVYKTVANGNDFFGNPIVLTLGSNSITVSAVNFDRAVKFQFSSGDVEFDALSLNGVASDCVSSLTSTENSNNQLFLKTFPNPSNGNLFIQSNELIERLQVQDISGRVVLDMNPQSEMVHIKNSQLKNNFYFVKCYIKKEWVTKKIIINQR